MHSMCGGGGCIWRTIQSWAVRAHMAEHPHLPSTSASTSTSTSAPTYTSTSSIQIWSSCMLNWRLWRRLRQAFISGGHVVPCGNVRGCLRLPRPYDSTHGQFRVHGGVGLCVHTRDRAIGARLHLSHGAVQAPYHIANGVSEILASRINTQ